MEQSSKSIPPREERLYRSDKERIIAGVAGGLAEYFRIDPVIVRLLFVFFTLFHGIGLLAYLVLWLVLPTRSSKLSNHADILHRNAEEISEGARRIVNSGSSRTLLGWIILLIGTLFLLGNLGLLVAISLAKLWPVILILLGIILLFRKR